MSKKAISKEFTSLQKDPVDDVDVVLENDNIRNWKLTFNIPIMSESLYAGGKFDVNMQFSNTYPFRPPRCTMRTKIFHINVSSKGVICIPIEFNHQWSPNKNCVRHIIEEIRDLFDQPFNPWQAGFDDQAFNLYHENNQLYKKYATVYTKLFAKDNVGPKFASRKVDQSIVDYFDNYCVEWQQLRVFWIGYYKNIQNNKCLITKLPKDIVETILQFVAEVVIY